VDGLDEEFLEKYHPNSLSTLNDPVRLVKLFEESLADARHAQLRLIMRQISWKPQTIFRLAGI